MEELGGISAEYKKELLKRYWPIYSSGFFVRSMESEVYFKRVDKFVDSMWLEAMESWYFDTGADRILNAIKSYMKNSYYSLFMRYADYSNYGKKLLQQDEDFHLLEEKFLEHISRSIDCLDEEKLSVADGYEFNKKELLMLYWDSYTEDVNFNSVRSAEKRYLELVRNYPDLMWKEAFVSWLTGNDASDLVCKINIDSYKLYVYYSVSGSLDRFNSLCLNALEPLFKIHVFDKVWQSIEKFRKNDITHCFGRPLSVFDALPSSILSDEDIKKLPNIDKKLLLSIFLESYSKGSDINSFDINSYLYVLDSFPDLLWCEAVNSWVNGNNCQDLLDAIRGGNESLSEYLVKSKVSFEQMENCGVKDALFTMNILKFATKFIFESKIRVPKQIILDYIDETKQCLDGRRRSLDGVMKCDALAKDVSLEDEKKLNDSLILCKKNLLKLYWPVYSKKCCISPCDTSRYLEFVETKPLKMWKELMYSLNNGRDATFVISVMDEDVKNPCMDEYLRRCGVELQKVDNFDEAEGRIISNLVDVCVSPIFEQFSRIEENSKKYGKVYSYRPQNGNGSSSN